MIRVTHDQEGYGLTVEGHAGAARNAAGHDLVCCAASTLMQTLLYTASKAGYMLDHDAREGYMHISITPGQHFTRELQVMFRVVEDGLEMLEAAYPQCIETDMAKPPF